MLFPHSYYALGRGGAVGAGRKLPAHPQVPSLSLSLLRMPHLLSFPSLPVNSPPPALVLMIFATVSKRL